GGSGKSDAQRNRQSEIEIGHGPLHHTLPCRQARGGKIRAFSSEVETGSRDENASNKNREPRSDSIGTEKALAPFASPKTKTPPFRAGSGREGRALRLAVNPWLRRGCARPRRAARAAHSRGPTRSR